MSDISLLQSNTVDFVTPEELEKRIGKGRPLRVKLGVDPTRPDLTLGHMVVFNKLRQFQDAGHTAVLIIGDFTTLIGDPSGRSSTRPVLTKEDIRQNAETYLEQAFRVLDKSKTEVRHNGDWFTGMGFEDCLRLARQMTVARMLERDDFSKRYKEGNPISIIEFLYPLVQGHDSVVVEADVELGGTDQLFNLLVGRQLQKDAGQPEQIIATMPLLIGTDGVKKMSKSQDNYIAFNDSPKDVFGKTMRINDEMMWDYYRLLLLESEANIEQMKTQHPNEMKKQLAQRLTSRLYDEATGQREREQFEQVFAKQELPDDMPQFAFGEVAGGASETSLANILAATGLFPSKKEVRRLIEQGAVKIDGEKASDPNLALSAPGGEMVIQAGKRKFVKITG